MLSPFMLVTQTGMDSTSVIPLFANKRFKLRFRSATESIENPMQFRTLRRDTARVLTILGEKRRKA